MIRLRLAATLFAAASLATLAVAGAAAATPNLVTNGNFNAGVNDWSIWSGVPGSLSWNAADHSLSVTNTSPPTLTTLASAQQCITGIDDGNAYTLTANAFVPSGQKRHGGAHARIYWYAGASCNGAVLSSPFASTFITSFDSWIQSKDSFVAPAGAKSANILLGVQQYKAGPGEDPTKHFTARWDSVSFVKNEIILDPPVTKTPSPTKTPPIIVIDPTGTPTNTPASTPTVIVVNPTTTTTTTPTPAPTETPDNQQTDDPTDTTTSTPTGTPDGGPTQQPQVQNTPNVPLGTNDTPLPPSTGSGAYGNGSSTGMPMFDLFAAALGLVALGGLALAVAQVKRQD